MIILVDTNVAGESSNCSCSIINSCNNSSNGAVAATAAAAAAFLSVAVALLCLVI